MDRIVLGIDIAKATVAVSLRRPNGTRRHKQLPNTTAGHTALRQWLVGHHAPHVHACLEATGTYGEAVATVLVEAGHTVSIVNPAAVKAFADSQLRRSKTDAIDADVLADFCLAHQPAAWTPWPRAVRELQGLVRRRVALVEMLTQEKNRQQAGELVPRVAASLTQHIAVLEREIAALEQLIAQHIDDHPELRGQRDLLLTIPGLGDTTIARLLSECRAVTDFASARAYAAFSGTVARRWESGTLRGRSRMSKLGSAHLRQALYFPAITAMRCNPLVQRFSARLQAAGKHKKVIIGAVMRKLLHIIYGVLKHQRPFDPTMISA